MARILLISGHGGNDSGAVANGLTEKTMNWITMKACSKVLQENGQVVIEDTENTKVSDEVKLINNINADITLNIHYNAGGGDGFEGYYYSSNRKAKKLLECIEIEVKALGQNSRGLKSGDHLAVIKNTTPLSVLVEGAFIDSNDRFIVDTIEEQEKLGQTYAKGILKYLGVTPKENTSTNKLYRVQVGAFKVKSNAEKLVNELKEKGYDSFIV